jgi:hypothetical protein
MTILGGRTKLGIGPSVAWRRTGGCMQPEARAEKFFIFFARNPLKSPDSEKINENK